MKIALGLRLSSGEDREFPLRLLDRGAIPQSRHHIPVGPLQPGRVGSHRNPKIHQRVHVVVRLSRVRRRWQKTDTRRHHADHRGRRIPTADAHLLADDLRIAVELPLPQFIPEDDNPHRTGPGFGLHEGAAQHGLQPRHVEIIFGDHHALDGFAALGADQKIEGPRVGGDSVKRLRLLLPFHPLLGGPTARSR